MRYIQTIKNQFDNKCKPIEWNKAVAENTIKAIMNPRVVEDKSKIPQWKFCSMKGEKRCTENMGSTDILMLDYDSTEYTIEQFQNRFRDYRYILHTSYSYDGVNQKFRVLLFLDKEYEINRFFFKGSQKQWSPYFYLIAFFDHVDPASFVRAQFFKCPAVKSKGSPYYYKINDGKKFNPFEEIEFFEQAYNECEWRQQNYLRDLEASYMKSRKRNKTGDLTKAKEYVEKTIESAPEGTRHNQIFALACWWKHIGGTYFDFKQIMPTWADSSYNHQLDRLEREWMNLK